MPAIMEEALHRETFVRLIADHQAIVHRVCRVYANTPADREELFQEICLQLWKAFPSFAGRSKITTWMYRVALNTALATVRRRRRLPEILPLGDHHLSAVTPPGPGEERLETLYAAMRRLNEGERAIILLWLEDKSYDEIGEIVGISPSYVGVKVVRIKEKLETIVRTIDRESR